MTGSDAVTTEFMKVSKGFLAGLITIPLWVVIIVLAGFGQTHTFAHWRAFMICVGGALFVAFGANIVGLILSIIERLQKKTSGAVATVAIIMNAAELFAMLALVFLGMSTR